MGYASKEEIRELYRKGNDLTKVNAIPADNHVEKLSEKNPKRVAVYCRVSTDGISQVTSFELQKKYYLKYVKRHFGWTLVGLYSDEGISATTIKNRIGLQLMLKDAIAGKIDIIVIKSISRFCRNLGDSIQIIKELKNLPRPVEIFFETENMSTLDPAMDLIIKVLSMVAEEESKKKSEAITAACRQRYEEGFFNIQDILGYRRVGVNKIEIDEEEAATVRLIYDMYLAGYDPEEIARMLGELGRKKHTHICLDGSCKEGDCNWNKDNVLNIFENEKRCGDVLAQKTYTFDCIEHIVRKNDKKVKMYYAVDQHPSIISRDEFYLARKIRSANRGGWRYGLHPIETHLTGPLKGFVRTVPGWYGYAYADYAKASMNAYGIQMPEDSLYPEYVIFPEETESDKPDTSKDKSPSLEHRYVVTEEEFEEDVEFTEEELTLFEEEKDVLTENVIKLQSDITDVTYSKNSTVGARLFSTAEKAALTIDKNGLSFNGKCHEYLNYDEIVIYYNPIYERLLIRPAKAEEPKGIRLAWRRNGKMHRASAQGLCNALYKGCGWNKEHKYKLLGRCINMKDGRYLEFDLSDPIIRFKVRKNVESENYDSKSVSLLDKILDEVVSTSDMYSDIDDIKDAGLVNKVENRSRAVYFKQEIADNNGQISIHDHEAEKFSPEFIASLKMNGLEPVEGWEYLEGMVHSASNTYDIFMPDWEHALHGNYVELMQYRSEERDEVNYLGWPTRYTFPKKEEVEKQIKEMSKTI